MKKIIELPEELLNYMFKWDFYAFVNDYCGWEKDKTEVPGFSREVVMEGHKIVSLKNGNEYNPQCSYLRKGNHLTIKLRDRTENWRDTEKFITLQDIPLFKDYPVVIQTNNEALTAIAPVFTKKQEVIIFLALIDNLVERLRETEADGGYHMNQILKDTQRLTLFLYKNNPDKFEEPSIFDEI